LTDWTAVAVAVARLASAVVARRVQELRGKATTEATVQVPVLLAAAVAVPVVSAERIAKAVMAGTDCNGLPVLAPTTPVVAAAARRQAEAEVSVEAERAPIVQMRQTQPQTPAAVAAVPLGPLEREETAAPAL
jgi:hypothetical protein